MEFKTTTAGDLHSGSLGTVASSRQIPSILDRLEMLTSVLDGQVDSMSHCADRLLGQRPDDAATPPDAKFEAFSELSELHIRLDRLEVAIRTLCSETDRFCQI